MAAAASSVAFDMPTLMGGTDDPKSLGEVGHCGSRSTSVADMEVLFDGIDLGDVTTLDDDQRPGGPGVLHDARRRRAADVDTRTLNGTLQTDIFASTSRRRSGCSRPSRT